MNNWKIVSQIALGFGIVFTLFAVFAAVINYRMNMYQYGSNVPAGFIQISILSSMLIFLLFGVLSFVVAITTMRSAKEKVENEPQSGTPEQKDESQTQEIKP